MNPQENQSIDELVRLSRDGDREAFTQLFDRRRALLTKEIQGRLSGDLRRRVDASDIVQEVFLDANRRLDEIAATEIPLEIWLRILVKQKVVDFQRRHIGAARRSLTREQALDNQDSSAGPVGPPLVASTSSPSRQLRRNEEKDHVDRLLAKLPPKDREILQLRHFDGLSNAEAATILQISINAASNRYVRALERFRSYLDHDS